MMCNFSDPPESYTCPRRPNGARYPTKLERELVWQPIDQNFRSGDLPVFGPSRLRVVITGHAICAHLFLSFIQTPPDQSVALIR
jgi:hypothetical protein